MRIVVVGVVAATVLAGCGGSSSPSGAPSITLYSGQHEQTTQALVTAFQQQTGIHVNVRSGDEATLATQIEQEGSASPADAFYAENSPALVALDEKRLLAPVDTSAVPARYSPTDHDWVGVSARVSTIVYNKTKLQPSQVPTSILDLAKPEWKGRIGIAPSETDFQPLITSIAKADGQPAALAWLQGLKNNAGDKNYPDNETLVSNINAGHVELGLINHYYWYRLVQEVGQGSVHSALSYFAPEDPGYVVDVSGAGVLKSSRHQAEAQRLVAFLVSAAGEGIIAHSFSYEYPLGSGVAADPQLKPFSQLEPDPLSIEDIGDGSLALQLLQKAQLA